MSPGILTGELDGETEPMLPARGGGQRTPDSSAQLSNTSVSGDGVHTSQDGSATEVKGFENPNYMPEAVSEAVSQDQSGGDDRDFSVIDNVRVEPTPEKKNPSVPFYKLYRYAGCKDIIMMVAGCLFAFACGFLNPISNMAFGRFTKAMIDKGQELANQTCPPPSSNGTTDFMKEVYLYMEFQGVLGATQFILGYGMVVCFNIVAENQVYRLRQNYFRSLLRQNIGWFDESSKRNFSIKIVEDMLKIQTALSEKVPMTIFSFTTFALLAATSFYYGWKLSLVMSSLVPVIVLVVIGQGYISAKITATEQESYSQAGAIAEEVFTNIRTVAAFNGQENGITKYEAKLADAKKTSVKKGILLGIGNGSGWLIYFVNYALAFWYGTHLVLQSRQEGNTDYGPDTLVIVLFGLIIGSWSLGSTSEYFEAFGAGKGAARDIFPIFQRVPEIDNMASSGVKPVKRIVGTIEFHDVNFSYPTRPQVPILQNVSLLIKPKTTVAIVGTSGSGKSTCVQLIQRFYDPISGWVSIDGVDIKTMSVQWLRSQIGVVSQEPVLFNGTIAENIKLGFKNATDDMMRYAAYQAYAHEFIQRLPKKYETRIGERGAQLSGGEKQRIAIARALIRNPPILLLDEATSALDMQSESIVQEALDRAKSGRTTIIIAHRLSTIRAADVVIVISEGKVVESGNHDELMAKKDVYYNLVVTQEQSAKSEQKSQEFLRKKGIENVKVEEFFNFSSEVAKGLSSASVSVPEQMISKTSLAIHEEEQKQKKEFRFRDFIKICAAEWRPMLASTCCTVIKSACLPFYSVIFGNFLALFSSTDDDFIRKTGNVYSLIFVVIACLMALMSFFQRYFANSAEYNLTLRVRRMLFRFVMYQDMSFFDEEENNVGQLTSRLSTDCTSIQGAAGSRLVGLTQALTIVILSVAMSFYFLPKMAAVTTLFVPLVLFSSFIEGRVLSSANLVEKESIERAANVAVEALNNIRTVASLGVEEYFLQKYTTTLQVAHQINLKRAHIRALVFGFVYAVPYFAYSSSVFFGSYLVETDCASIADVFKVSEALIFGTMSGGAALAFAPDYDKGKIAAVRILKLFKRKPTIDSFAPGKDLKSVNGEIEANDVKFSYASRPNIRVLDGFSFTAKPKQKIAIVGPSGSGKSTTAALLLRFYDPNSGKVMLEGEDIRSLDIKFLRSQFAIVSQEPALFDCTLRENIAYGDTSRDVPDSEIIEVAKEANIHNFISRLPSGYDTRVGSLGNQLSGGQKQRVAIARALLRRPKVLIFDEATSALDVQSEKIVQIALDAASDGRTSVTIAHRLSSVVESDIILVVSEGKIVEAGKHEELMEAEGIYYAMWTSQLRNKNTEL